MFLNVAFVGEQGVGKASLKQMLVMHNQTKDSENNEQQVAGMGSVSSIKIAGRRVKIDCVNTSDCLARPESFWRKQLHGLVLLYDMSSPTTFDAVSSLVRQVRAAGFLSASAKQAVPVVLLANKADRGGFVCSEVNEFCLEQNVKLVEVCCSQPDLKSALQSARSVGSASSQLREAAIVAIHQMIQEISASSRGGQSSPSGAPPSVISLSSGCTTPTASRRSRRQRRSSSFGMGSQSGAVPDEIQDASATSSSTYDPNGAANALISAFQTECTVASSGSTSTGPVPRLSFGHGSQMPILTTGSSSSSSSGAGNVPVSPSPSPKRRRRSLLDVGSNAFSAIIPHKKKKRRRDTLSQDPSDSESDASDSDSEMSMVDFDAQPQSGSSSLTPRGLFSSLSSGNKGENGHQMGPFASQILSLDGAFALEDVLEVLLFGRQDSRQVQKLSEDFLMSFRSSITVNQLIDALIGRWRGPSVAIAADPTAAGRLLKSRRSIVDLLIKWMEVMDEEDPILCSADAETVMAKEKLSVFIETEIASIAQNSEAFDRLQLLWTRKFSQVILGGASSAPVATAPQKPLATARLMELEPTTVAQQLTIMFSRMFSKIKTAELVDCAWAHAEKAPNLSTIIRESNRIQQWVWTQVLQQAESIRERVQVIQWFIQVASRCLQPLKNFESMYAIVRGLTSLPVDRLKRTWSMVDESLKKKLDSMNQMMLQPEGSTKSYRNELKRSNPPCVPYPGYWLSKLVRIKEQNGLLVPTLGANCSPESTLIVNLASFEANCKVIRWWKRYQQSQYNLSLDKDVLSLLRSITPTVTDDDQAYELSLQHEPVGQNVPVSSSSEASSGQSSSSSQESGSSLKKLRRLSSSSGSLNLNEKVDEKIKKLDRKANDLMQIYMALKATLTVDDTATTLSSSAAATAMQDISCPSPSPIRRSGSGNVVLSEAILLTDEARRNYEDMMKQARKLLKNWATRCENTSKFLDYYSPDGERQSLRFADILSKSSAVETLCLVLSGRAIESKTRICIRKIFGQCLVGSESEQELLIQLIETQLQDVNADSIQLVNELLKCFKIPESYLANRNKITIVTRQIDQERQHCDEVLARLEQLTAFFDPSANNPTSARAQQEDKLLTEVLESKRRVSALVQQRQQLCQWKDNTKHVMFENYGKFLQTYESRLQKQRQDRRNTLIQRLNEAVTTQTNQKRLIDEKYQSKQTDHSRQQKKIEARQRELLAEQQELERLLAENREKQRQAEAEAAKLQQRVARRKNEYRSKIDELQSHVKSLESEVTETERDQQLQNQKKHMMSRFFSYFQQVSQSARDANENQENHQRVIKDFYLTLSTQLSKRHQMMRDLREESRVMYDSVKSVERMQLRPEIILKEFPELIQKCKDLLNRSDRFRADYISFAKTCIPETSEISSLVQVVPAAHPCLKLSEELAEMIRQVADARQYLAKFASI